MRDSSIGVDPAESAREQPEFDIRSFLDILRRRRLVIALVALPLLIPATVAPFLMEHYYEATATIAIRSTPEVMEFGANFMPAEGGASPYGGRGSSSETSLLTLVLSDAVIGRVVDQLPDFTPAKKSLFQASVERVRGGATPELSEDQLRAMRTTLLRLHITPQVVGGGSYLRITAVDGSARGAAFLANATAEAFVRYQSDQRDEASRRAVAWLNQQVFELREQAARKEGSLAGVIANKEISPSDLESVDDDEDTSRLASVDSELREARIDLLAAQERLAVLRPRTESSGGSAPPDPALSSVRESYTRAMTELDSARLRFMPTHPEIRRLEGIVATLGQRLGPGSHAASPVLTASEESEYQRLRSEESRLQARVRVLDRTRTDMFGATDGTRAAAVARYRRLQKELEVDKQMLDVLMTRRNETLLAAATTETGAQMLDPAIPPTYAAGPKRVKYLAAGWVLVIVAGFAAGFGFEMLDRRVRDLDEIARQLGTSSLGIIPMVKTTTSIPERDVADSPISAVGECYRTVRTALLFLMRAHKLQYLVVSSAIAGEGKTMTCSNLAAAFGRLGKRVIVIDADMRRPRMHRVFNLRRSPGLSEILEEKARIEDCVLRPDKAGFDLVPAGSLPENPSELIGSTAFAQLMADLKSDYDLVILDSPVLLAVPDALLLAAHADGTLLVHKPGSVDRRGLRRMREDLSRAGARVLGVVFNQIDSSMGSLYPTYLYSPYLEDAQGKRRKRQADS